MVAVARVDAAALFGAPERHASNNRFGMKEFLVHPCPWHPKKGAALFQMRVGACAGVAAIRQWYAETQLALSGLIGN